MAEYEFFLHTDDDSLPKTSALYRYYDLCNQAAAKIGTSPYLHFGRGIRALTRYLVGYVGREFKIVATLEPILKDTGYVQVHYQTMKIPFGTWPADKHQKEMGAYLYMTAEKGFESFGMALLTRGLEMEVKEAEAVIVEAIRESTNTKKIHAYSRQ